VHEGYIKGQGQFSLDLPEMVMTDGPVMVINPQLLLEAIQKEFREYCRTLTAAQEVRLCETAASVFRRRNQKQLSNERQRFEPLVSARFY
jgi:hypothetical protein